MGLKFYVQQPAKVAPFAGGNEAAATKLLSEKGPQAAFSNELERTCAVISA